MQATTPQMPQRHQITVEELFRMGKIRVFEPGARIELLDGELIDMPPIGPPHASRTKRPSKLLHHGVGDRAIVSTRDPIILGDLNAPKPDVALLKPRDDFYESRHPQAADVLLAIEVAETSLGYDRDRKLPLYARFGIPEVWLIDVAGRAMTVFPTPQPAQRRYATRFPLEPPRLIRPGMLPDVELDLSTLR
jgi:Uma2 family endonuclease